MVLPSVIKQFQIEKYHIFLNRGENSRTTQSDKDKSVRRINPASTAEKGLIKTEQEHVSK